MVSFICFVGLASLEREPLRAVPACPPLMPASDMIPIAAAVSSRLRPIALATGATYFMASPISKTSAFVSAAARAKTFATCPAELASKAKARIVDAATSDAAATSPPDTAARSSRPGIADIISLTLKPADARFSMPAAAAVAEKDVSAPSCLARSSRACNSVDVAPDIAWTRDNWASYSEPILITAPVIVVSAVLTAPIAAVVTFRPELAKWPSLDRPFSKPLGSSEVSITTSPSAKLTTSCGDRHRHNGTT